MMRAGAGALRPEANRFRAAGIVLMLLPIIAACRTPDGVSGGSLVAIDELARRYVVLTLAAGEHDADFVDAYYGPGELREEARALGLTLPLLAGEVSDLLGQLSSLPAQTGRMEQLRVNYLQKQTRSMLTRLAVLEGRQISFDDESRAIYDAMAPQLDAGYFQQVIEALEHELPGEGTLSARVETFRRRYAIPLERLDQVFRTAVQACRERTLRQIDLPAGESFTIEYVTDKPWSGYNWYQGGYRSVIQVNTDLPVFIDRALDLACHEGYPGHHAYNVLLEKSLVRDRGWIEFTVYPLFSSQSLIAEGSANYGVDLAFPPRQRIEFEKEVLFPAAGLDPADADRYYRVHELISRLSYAGNEAARRYLDGEWTAEQAVDWLVRYTLSSPERARQRIRFFEKYRSYVINYNVGKDLVRQHVEAVAGSGDHDGRRWEVFEEILSSPMLPSTLER